MTIPSKEAPIYTSSGPLPPSPSAAAASAALEETHVHQVYSKIASHFSSTRYAAWPVVASFLQARKPGSVGLDIGCGNGKYLATNTDVFIIGSDRSSELVNIAAARHDHQEGRNTGQGTGGDDDDDNNRRQTIKERGNEVLICDGLQTPHPCGRFDFVICIAVLHHYSSPARRVAALTHILSLLAQDGGEALVYVWALEQKTSRRGWDDGDPQDIMVPWKTVEDGKEVVYERFYHLYKKGDLESDVEAAGGSVVRSGYDRDNWWAVVASKK